MKVGSNVCVETKAILKNLLTLESRYFTFQVKASRDYKGVTAID